MLHIHNGDSSAGTLRQFGFPGEHRDFQEVLIEGPAPRDISSDEWTEVRARFLADAYDLKLEDSRKDLREQEVWLRGFSNHDETILWFEHDLFCQINLIYLLDWFSNQSRANKRLSLICIDQFDGVGAFRGLGELTGEQLASLFEGRHRVTDSELDVAVRAWAAYRSPNPREIQLLLEEDTSAMPFLRTALALHLARFPSLRNGLGRVENTALDLISGGAVEFKALFLKFGKAEPVYGLGDLQFWSALQRLGDAKNPLITISGGEVRKPESNANCFHHASFELTETGRAILAGERDFVATNGIDLWLGGVHLNGGGLWRFDEDSGSLTHRH